jgi:hypothetical protein
MTTKYTNILHCKTLKNLPKFGILGLKIYHVATLVPSLCLGSESSFQLPCMSSMHYFCLFVLLSASGTCIHTHVFKVSRQVHVQGDLMLL